MLRKKKWSMCIRRGQNHLPEMVVMWSVPRIYFFVIKIIIKIISSSYIGRSLKVPLQRRASTDTSYKYRPGADSNMILRSINLSTHAYTHTHPSPSSQWEFVDSDISLCISNLNNKYSHFPLYGWTVH